MPTPRAERWLALSSFARARWGTQLRNRVALESWQGARLAYWLPHELPRARCHAHEAPERLEDLPIVDKARLLGSFDAYNVHGISLAMALDAARRDEDVDAPDAEGTDDLAFGLSSGTSGARSVFITNGAERATWMGILIARALPSKLLASSVLGAGPLRVSLFLRANNRLYRTLKRSPDRLPLLRPR